MKANVLIVEDNPQVAERHRLIFNHVEAFNVAAVCATEDQALEACDRNRIDLALIDLQLAQGTGFGVIRRLRARDKNAPIALIVVVTNHAVPALKVASFEAGADYFVDKKQEHILHNIINEFIFSWGKGDDSVSESKAAE